MSVIGRLDEQVDAMLIAPLAKKGEQDKDSGAAQRHENTGRSQTATVTTRAPQESENRGGDGEELPVWLL